MNFLENSREAVSVSRIFDEDCSFAGFLIVIVVEPRTLKKSLLAWSGQSKDLVTFSAALVVFSAHVQ